MNLNREYYEAASPAREDYWRYMAAPRARVARIVELVRQLAPKTLVDLGCGNGRLLEEIAQAMPDVRLAGIDLSTRQIEENRARMPQVEWLVADLNVGPPSGRPSRWPLAGAVSGDRTLPAGRRRDGRPEGGPTLEPTLEPTCEYDVVVASEVIEHLDDGAMLLRNAHALAKRGGHLVLTTQSGPLRETERRVGHIRHFTAAELRALLEQSGWTPLPVWNEGWPFHDLSKWWANRDADASMARFGGHEGYGFREKAICFALRAAFRLNSRRRGAQLYALARKDA